MSRWRSDSSPAGNGFILCTPGDHGAQKIKMQRETTPAMGPWTDGDQPGACRDCTLIGKRVNDPAIKHTEMVSSRLHRAGVSAVPVIYCRGGLRQQVSCECFDQVAVGTKRASPPTPRPSRIGWDSNCVHVRGFAARGYANLSNLAVAARTRGLKLLLRSRQRQLRRSAVHTKGAACGGHFL